VDGDDKIETILSPALLPGGNMVYKRESPNVEIRLRVFGADNDSSCACRTGQHPLIVFG